MSEQQKQPEVQEEIVGRTSEQVGLIASDYLAEVVLIKKKVIGEKNSEVLEFTFKLLDVDPNAAYNQVRGIASFPDGKILVGKSLYKWCSILAGGDIGKDKDFKISSLVGKKCKVITENKTGKNKFGGEQTFTNVKDVLALKPRDLETIQALSNSQPKTPTQQQSAQQSSVPQANNAPAADNNKAEDNFF